MVCFSQLLWAGVGRNHRKYTAPSAGGLNPVSLYVLTNDVDTMPKGLYKYDPVTHALDVLKEDDFRDSFYRAVLSQEAVRNAAANFVLAASFVETVERYGERGRRYVYMTAGAVAQNIALQATALRLGSVVMGAFKDRTMKRLLDLELDPICVVCVGRI